MASISFKLDGVQAAIDKLQKTGGEIAKEIDMEIASGTQRMAKVAKVNAPADMGDLRRKISARPVKFLSYELVAQTDYAAYVEFGTKSKFDNSISDEAKAAAAQFKGKGRGDLKAMERNLTAWVRRKGLAGTYSVKTKKRTGNKANQAKEDKQVARAIMFYILKYGIKPQPYFFPAYYSEKPKLIAQITNILNEKRK